MQYRGYRVKLRHRHVSRNEDVYLRLVASLLLFGCYDGLEFLLSPLLLTTVATIQSAGVALNVCDDLLRLVRDGLFDIRPARVHVVFDMEKVMMVVTMTETAEFEVDVDYGTIYTLRRGVTRTGCCSRKIRRAVWRE